MPWSWQPHNPDPVSMCSAQGCGCVFHKVASEAASENKPPPPLMNFPGGSDRKESACYCMRPKRCKFNPWVGKIPWRREWQSTPVVLLGESHGQRNLASYSL